MIRKKKLLILTHNQFGTSTTSFKHCEFAREFYDTTYLGWDYGQPKVELSGVTVKHVSRKSNLFVRNFRLLRAFHEEIGKGYDIIFTNYVRGISLVRMLNPSANIIMYIDTLGVMTGKFKRFIFDSAMRIELLFFKKVTLINKGIGERLGIFKFHVIPLGGDCFRSKDPKLDDLSLIYVGTLSGRNIIECVKGFHQYLGVHGTKKNAKFTIIGDSTGNELNEIKAYISEHNLAEYVKTTGFVDREHLGPFFNKANVGVSYVPITPYYQYQPPTKTYEYLISGLPVIATYTRANEEIVDSDAGLLIADNPDAFCKAVLNMEENIMCYDNKKIRRKYDECSWENVVKNVFHPVLEELSSQSS